MGTGFYAQNLFPLLSRSDAEAAHHATLAGLHAAAPVLRALACLVEPPLLPVTAFGLEFPFPIGLAAGLDKHAQALDAWPLLGFGFAEIGTVTPRPQPGNPRPRLFRIPEMGAVVNRMGFNSEGAATVAARLPPRGSSPIPIGVNVGKNKDTPNEAAAEDYVLAIETLRQGADYLVVNVSSPNTPQLRALQSPEFLHGVVRAAVQAAAGVPLLAKVAPDFGPGELEDAVVAAVEAGAEGIVVTNTTLSRPRHAHPVLRETGGLSGAPLHALAVQTVRRVHAAVGHRVPIVGVGGVRSADDALRMVDAGATLVQVYTALVFEGPGLVRAMARELSGVDWLGRVGRGDGW
ncbi:MAG: quinone-dependent dihydroorotate dehydrogenase [Deltaproteobacteria bacterium]|nr:quinone-dependent dihydroorotate dehydrogenase [Deltaproteobacteria bacterium]